MGNTAFSPLDRSRAAPLHDFGPPQMLEAFNMLATPGGGLWSTATDLIAFGQVFFRGGTSAGGYRLLSPASIALTTSEVQHGHAGVWHRQSIQLRAWLG